MTSETTHAIRVCSFVSGPTLPEPIEVLATASPGAALKVIGRGSSSGLTHDSVLTAEQVAQLTISEFVARHRKGIAADLPLRRSESEPCGSKTVGGSHGA